MVFLVKMGTRNLMVLSTRTSFSITVDISQGLSPIGYLALLLTEQSINPATPIASVARWKGPLFEGGATSFSSQEREPRNLTVLRRTAISAASILLIIDHDRQLSMRSPRLQVIDDAQQDLVFYAEDLRRVLFVVFYCGVLRE